VSQLREWFRCRREGVSGQGGREKEKNRLWSSLNSETKQFMHSSPLNDRMESSRKQSRTRKYFFVEQ